jgi:Uma2 family endonuclease
MTASLTASQRSDPDLIEQVPESSRGDPTWEIVRLVPRQGEWTEEQYLDLGDNTRIEFVDGVLEFLSKPNRTHQRIAGLLYRLLFAYVSGRQLGEVYFMGYPVRIRSGNYRVPDVLYVSHTRKLREKYCEGADLVMEVLSVGARNRQRDLDDKRADYAAGGIPEYWIVDPESQTITVLALEGDAYRLHGEFRTGEAATSAVLEGFTVDVQDCFAAAQIRS